MPALDYVPTTDQPITKYQPNIYKEAAIDEPRIAYNLDGTIRGLMVEESRTNLFDYSDVSSGTAEQISLGAEIPGPTINLTKLVSNTTSTNAHRFKKKLALSAGAHVFTAEVKQADFADCQILIFDVTAGATLVSASFGFASETVTTGGSSIGSGFSDKGNGVYELWVATTVVNAGDHTAMLIPKGGTYAGNGWDGTYFGHLGLYEGSAPPLAPIVTQGSQVTKGNENPEKTTDMAALFPNPNKYGFVVESELPYTPAAGKFPRVLEVDSGSNNDRFSLASNDSGRLAAFIFTDNQIDGEVEIMPAGEYAGTGKHRVAVFVDNDAKTVRASVDGGDVITSPITTNAPKPARIGFGEKLSGGHYLNGYLHAGTPQRPGLQILQGEHTDADLKALSA